MISFVIFSVKRAWQGFWRNAIMSLAATATMVLMLLLLSGFLTRAISIPFVVEMLVAMLSTKISLYLGTSPLPLPPSPPKIGAWAVLHEIRSEWAQLMSVLYLMIVGPGSLSVDAIIARARAHRKPAASAVGLVARAHS